MHRKSLPAASQLPPKRTCGSLQFAMTLADVEGDPSHQAALLTVYAGTGRYAVLIKWSEVKKLGLF